MTSGLPPREDEREALVIPGARARQLALVLTAIIPSMTICLVIVGLNLISAAAALSLGLLLFAVLGRRAARPLQLRVDSSSLELQSPWTAGDIPPFPSRIAVSDLRTGAAEVVDLASRPDLRPTTRLYGAAFPGYRSGWFALANGTQANVALTRTQHVLHLPTAAGYSLLLTPDQPLELLERLRSAERGVT